MEIHRGNLLQRGAERRIHRTKPRIHDRGIEKCRTVGSDAPIACMDVPEDVVAGRQLVHPLT